MELAGNNSTNELTVFLISTGEDTLDECRAAIKNQNCSFKLEMISDVYPMSRAFQTMPERCTTRYFVQVDADMVLYPHAVQTLYDGIRSSGLTTLMVYGRLYEEGFGPGGAVKCWKRDLFRLFRFRDVRTVDRDLSRRMSWLGLRRYNLKETLGIHRPRHSFFSEYLKSKTDVEKWRFLGRPPSQYAGALIEKLLADFPESRHRLLGALLGALTCGSRLGRSKDIRFERGLYNQILQILNCEPTLGHIPLISVDCTHALRQQFVDGYVCGSDKLEPRDALATSVVKVFSDDQSDGANTQLLLDLTSQ